jgi:sulfatase maturation enzyme AslB (radical SAM superfamily)
MGNTQYWNNDAFCPLPWGSIYVETDGRVDSCCIAHNNLGNLHQTKLQNIVGGSKNIQIKQEMLAGQRAQGCKVCYAPGDNVDEGRKYHRDNQLVEFDTWQPDKAFFDHPENFKLQYADLRFRNTCNYGCVYCGPDLSSTWASELKQFVKIDESAIADVTQYFVDNAADLRKIYMAGGEPLLIKENQVILEKLLEINPHCHLVVNTNLSMIRGNRIFELLTKFPNVDWLISAEDMGNRYNYIRYPGDWSVFAENLDILKAVIPATHKVKFNMVFSALNAKTIWNYVDFLLDNGHARDYDHLNLAYINNGHQFIWCDARALPASYIEEVKEIITARTPTGTRFDQELQFVLDCLDVPVVDNGYHNLFIRLAELDQRRHLDSRTVFSDIYSHRQT